MFRTSIIISYLLLSAASMAFAAENIAVIVNRENTNTIDRAMIAKIYLGSISRWPSGGTIVAYDQPEDNASTSTFAARVLGKPVRVIKDIWAQNVFTGKAIPPKILSSDDEVKKAVARSRNTIGYIRAGSVDNSVKVVFTVQ